jgi:hypothetical protein
MLEWLLRTKLLQDCVDPLEISSLASRADQGDGSDERSGYREKELMIAGTRSGN